MNCIINVTLSFSLGIPVVKIEYMAAWKSYNAPLKGCFCNSLMINHSEEMKEEMLILCNTSAVDVDISFQYETQAFMVNILSISN